MQLYERIGQAVAATQPLHEASQQDEAPVVGRRCRVAPCPVVVEVLAADPGELCVEDLEVAEEALDVRLVGRGAGPAVVLGDRHQRHELAGVVGGHLGAVV